MSEIILSIILPAYNVAEYIEECIESCERQDIPHDSYEIVVVNDGSTDCTLDKVQTLSIKYSNIKIINQSNQGVSVARNNGFKEAYQHIVLNYPQFYVRIHNLIYGK